MPQLTLINLRYSQPLIFSGFKETILKSSLNMSITDIHKYSYLIHTLGLESCAVKLAFELQRERSVSLRVLGKIRLNEYFFRADLHSYCPQCLSEGAYWRRRWLLKPYAVCLQHSVELVDACPHCGRGLSSDRGKICFCSYCGLDLRSCYSKTINNESVFWLMRSLSNGDSIFLKHLSEFWTVISRFENIDEVPLSDYVKSQITYLFFTNMDDAVRMFSALVSENYKCHPRIQLVEFLIASERLISFAELVLTHCNPCIEKPANTRSGSLTNPKVCAILGICRDNLEQLILRGKIKRTDLFSGRIATTEVEHVLYENIVNDDEFLGSIEIEDLLLKDDLDVVIIAYRLGVPRVVVQSLITKDWLCKKIYIINGCRKLKINKSNFDIYNNAYVLSGTLEKELNVNHSALVDYLRYQKILPIGGPEIDGLNMLLFRRIDVNLIKSENIVAIYPHKILKSNYCSSSKATEDDEYVSHEYVMNELSINFNQLIRLINKVFLISKNQMGQRLVIQKASLIKFFYTLKRKDFVTFDEAAAELGCSVTWMNKNIISTGELKKYDYIYWKFVKRSGVEKVRNKMKVTLDDNGDLLRSPLSQVGSKLNKNDNKIK